MRRVYFFYFHFFLLLLLVSACGKEEKIAKENSKSSKGEIPPTEVITVMVEEKKFEYMVDVTGIIQPMKEAQVLVKSTGIIKRIYIQNGNYIPAGQLIAEFENDKQKLDLEKAEAILAEKRISYEDLRLSYNRVNDTLAKNKILENIRISSGLVSAELNYRQVLLDFEKTRLKSPIAGLVSGLFVKENNSALEGTLVAIVYDPSTLMVHCQVLEGDALQMKRGFPAQVWHTGSRNLFLASVYDIDPRVDEKTRMVSVLLWVKDKSGFIPGMSVQATIKIPNQTSLLVPKEAVVIKSGKSVVFTEENGLAKWNYINCGRENGKDIEVLSGLEKGKKVIISNNLQLAHDAPVKVAN